MSELVLEDLGLFLLGFIFFFLYGLNTDEKSNHRYHLTTIHRHSNPNLCDK